MIGGSDGTLGGFQTSRRVRWGTPYAALSRRSATCAVARGGWIRSNLARLLGATVVPLLLAPGALAAGSPLELSILPDGSVELREAGKRIAAISLTTPALRRGTATVREVAIGVHRVVEVRVPVRGAPREEVWIAELAARAAGAPPAATVIWRDEVGSKDADNEVARAVEVTGSGVVEFQTAAHVTRCDGEAVRLFPRGWDFAGGRFRPLISPLPAPATRKLIARRGDPEMPAGRPIGGFRFTAASTTSSAGTDARALGSPVALDDGDPATVWAEGLGGDGRGEFLTARATAAGYRVRGLRILPGDASSPTALRASNRPRRFLLSLGPAADQRFEIEIADDPAADPARSRQPYWVALPTPVESTCLTLVLTDIIPGSGASPPRSFGTTAISDIDVFTELDGPAGIQRLVEDIGKGAGCSARVPLLVGLGEPAVLPCAQAIVSAGAAAADRAGRECLLEAMTTLAPVPRSALVIDALVAALRNATPQEERLALAALRRAAEPPVATLARILGDPKADVDTRLRVARALAALERPDAIEALVAGVGRGPAPLRAGIILALGGAPAAAGGPAGAGRPASDGAPAPVDRVGSLLSAVRTGAGDGPGRHSDLLRALAAVAARDTTRRAEVLDALRAPLTLPADFEVRARSIMALGTVKDTAAVPDLARVRTDSDDAVLRHLAAQTLGVIGGAAAISALRAAVADVDPRVRESAALGLGTLGDRPSGAALIAAAKQEPWPFVRRAELEALGHLCVAGTGDLMITATTKDVPEVRRAALIALARCKDPRAKGVLLRTAGRRNDSATLRELAANLLGDLGDRTACPDLDAALGRVVVESQADLALEGVAATMMRADARLCGAPALPRALELIKDARPMLQQAAIEALGVICDPGAGTAALRAATGGTNPSLAAAAIAAQKRCIGR